MRYIGLFLLFLPVPAWAQLQVAGVFSANMVLQRNSPIPVWGKAVPGKTVNVTLGSVVSSAVAEKDSAWIVYLPGQKATKQPRSLTISSDDTTVVFRNILLGDLWLCIGQSNMEWPMSKELHYHNEIQHSDQPLLRFCNPTYAGKNIFAAKYTDSVLALLNLNNFYKGSWQNCDSNSFKQMSAVAYYFGKRIAHHVNIPVGLINLSIGGAPLETFIDAHELQNSREFPAKAQGNWLENDALPVWVRERGNQNVGSLTKAPADALGKNHAFKPGFAFEAGIQPLIRLPITGIICYQGESNAQETDRVIEYVALSKLMINSFRRKWKQPRLPFYFVQLSSIDTLKYKGHLWPQFRNEQRKMMHEIDFSGMAVCSDMGFRNDVHPTNKKDVGERLARWALNKTYREPIIPSGPLPVKAVYRNGKVIISFKYTGKGLQLSGGTTVRGFSVDGRTDAKATIGGKNIIVPAFPKPQYIYYAWKPFSDGNLVNTERLPASTFKIPVE